MKNDAIVLLCLTLAAAPAAAATTTHAKSSASSPATAVHPTRGTRAAGPSGASAVASQTTSSADSDSMTMHGGQEGTVFKSLTVQGEDRIRLDFERPPLDIQLDPSKAPGLDWGSARDVLDRTSPDLSTPLVMTSARETSPYVGHPWLSHFASGAVARFQPDVKGVESWKLSIVNARGEAVQSFSGKGEPPHEITWDGRSASGAPVVPGLTYSYVLEAHDKAGNKRNFVGQGFKVSAYRVDTAEGPIMAMSARELPAMTPGRSGAPATGSTPPILIEAASWLNQRPQPGGVRVTVTARSSDEAQALADFVTRSMSPYLIGDPSRVQAIAEVQADAPDGGTIRIAPSK
jgi:hypothetical protein